MPKQLLDIIRVSLVFIGTIIIVPWLWDVHWALGGVLALPVFVILLNVIGFLTLPFYGLTSEHQRDRKALKKFEEEYPDLARKSSNEDGGQDE